ncbi:MAG TPA: POTRA domain-containing protein, partial [Polyangiaceae bacterium]|nr:POTRA domain-containing protein [Polyangiaceae bacterium]
ARAARADDASPADDAARGEVVSVEDAGELALAPDTLDSALVGLPIVRVEVKLRGKSQRAKIDLKSVQFGEPLTAAVARRAMRELAARGGFSTFAAEAERAGSGVVLRIVAVPSLTLAAVQIQGSVLDRAATLKAAHLVVGGEITDLDFDALPERLEKHYAEHGFPAAKIGVTHTPLDDPSTVLVAIDIDPGEPRLVSQRVFVIEPAWDAHVGDLKSSYAVKGDDRVDEGALSDADRDLSEKLHAAGFYKARVYHRTRVTGPYTYLYIYVDSGPKLVPVFEGNHAFDGDQLTRALDLGEGQVGAPPELADKLRKFYVAHGFLDAEVTPDPRVSADPGLEYFALVIREGDRVEVEKRIFTCLPKEVDPDDVGSEIDDVLEDELPSDGVLSVPSPRVLDATLSTGTTIGGRAEPLDLSPASTYSPEVYPRALKRVREVYLAKGYLNAIVGPASVVRARCSKASPPGECIEEPLPKLSAVCRTDDVGLPIQEAAAPAEATCVPDRKAGIRCSPRVTLRIPMQLGPVTHVWDLAFDGNRTLGDRDLADVADLELGAPVNLTAIEEAKSRLVEHYQNKGFAFVDVNASVEPSPDRTRARVHFVIDERDRVIIDGIDVEGAVRTDPALVASRVAFEKGDFFSKEGLRVSEERIATLGPFSSVSVTLAEPNVPERRKRLVVRVAEYPSQYIEPKVGFSTGEGLRFGLEYGHRNIGSLAIALTLRVQLSYLFDFMIVDSTVAKNLGPLPTSQRLERRNSIKVSFPEIGLGPLVSLGIEGVDVRDNQRDFGLTREAVVPSLTYHPTREVVGTLSASVEVNDEQIFSGGSVLDAIKNNPSLEHLLLFPDGTTFAVAQRIGISWDRRDNAFAATQGTFVTADVEHVDALPADPNDPTTTPIDSHFLRLQGRFAGYLRFTDKGLALALSVAGGGNIQLSSDSQTYPDRLFYLGGFDSIRSFLSDSVVPQDVADRVLAKELRIEDVAIRGGNLTVNPRAELRVPLTGTFAIGLFLDAANVWVDPTEFDPFKLRYGAGAGLRVTTPIGPLALDYGFNLDPHPWEDPGALHFSIGLF